MFELRKKVINGLSSGEISIISYRKSFFSLNFTCIAIMTAIMVEIIAVEIKYSTVESIFGNYM